MQQRPRLQTLLTPMPSGSKNLGDLLVSMPEEVVGSLREIFQLEVMGDNRFEDWGPDSEKFWEAFRAFGRMGHEGRVVQIDYDPGGGAQPIYILCGIDLKSVTDTIEFIEDQLSEQPKIECVKYPGIREAVLDDKKRSGHDVPETVGWFDLDNRRFLFVDVAALWRLKGLLKLHTVPVIDQNMNLIPRIGSDITETRRDLERLAQDWGTTLEAEHNPGQVVTARAAYNM